MKKLVWIMFVGCLGGCSSEYATNDKQQYLESQNGAPLVVPPPMTRSNLSGFYELPEPAEGQRKVSVVPPKP